MRHEPVIVLAVRTTQTPSVRPEHRLSVGPLGDGIHGVWVQDGFMQDPNVPEALAQAREPGVEIDPEDVTYFLGRETIVVTPGEGRGKGMARWREKL